MNMDNKKLIAELSKLRPASTFLSLAGYHSEYGEIADFSIVFHMSYENALKRSLEVLDSLEAVTALEKVAKEELQHSFTESLLKLEKTPIEELDDEYTRFFDDDGSYIKGVKVHTASDVLHLYGLVVHKRSIVPGAYPARNRRPLTVAKDKMRSLTPVGKFRQFKILPNTVDRITVEKMSLLPSSF